MAPSSIFTQGAGRESPEPAEVPLIGAARPVSAAPNLPFTGGVVQSSIHAPTIRLAPNSSITSSASLRPAQLCAPAVGSADENGSDRSAPDKNGMTRNGYIFGGKYKSARHVHITNTHGLQSIDCYENLGLVGRGAFNKIYKARHRETGEIVALKAMQLAALEQAGQVLSDDGIPLEMMREMSILMSIRHPNIVAVLEVVIDHAQMFLVMELVDFDLGLLIEHMKHPFSEGQVKCLATQLLSALAAVHECFVLHRDLKQTNLLLDKNGVLKLCDFGLARRHSGFSKLCTPNVTSLWYRAPEILVGEVAYGPAVDMWSFGCIFAEWLQHGEPLMQGSGEIDQINTIFKLLGTPSDISWPKFRTFRVVQAAIVHFVDCHTISLGPDGSLMKLPKNSLRKHFPAEGYSPDPACIGQRRSTALSDSGYDLLSSALSCNPERRVSATAALEHVWFREEPLPVPLSRSEIRQLRRNRDDAISSGAHEQALAQQRAQTASKVAAEHAAAIAASIKQRMGL